VNIFFNFAVEALLILLAALFLLWSEKPVSFMSFAAKDRGGIKKIIQFQRADHLGKNVFNLAFGDLNEATGRLEDGAASNNGDQLKIMHTVERGQ
jgi:hypothetical protein